MTTPSARRPTFDGRLLALAALVAFVWVQAAVAEHRFDHDVTDLSVYCDDCAKLDRLEDAAVDCRPPVATVIAAPTAANADTASQSDRHPRLYDSRAPPFIRL